MVGLGDWKLKNTDFSWKTKTPDWCMRTVWNRLNASDLLNNNFKWPSTLDLYTVGEKVCEQANFQITHNNIKTLVGFLMESIFNLPEGLENMKLKLNNLCRFFEHFLN